MDPRQDMPTQRLTAGSTSSSINNPYTPERVAPPKRSAGRPFRAFLLFLLGIIFGILATLLFVIFASHDASPVTTPPSSQNGSIIVQINNSYLTQLVAKGIKTSGMPGDVSNVQVTLVHDGPITVNGDDHVGVLGLGITKHFSLTVQPFIQSCQMQVHVLHADLADIPVTGFVSLFEGQINQGFQVKTSDLPPGFTYCVTSVRTEPDAMFITYSATPT